MTLPLAKSHEITVCYQVYGANIQTAYPMSTDVTIFISNSVHSTLIHLSDLTAGKTEIAVFLAQMLY